MNPLQSNEAGSSLEESINTVDKDVIKINKSMLTVLLLVIIQLIYTVWWAAEISTKVDNMVTTQKELSSSLVLLGDPNSEIARVQVALDRLEDEQRAIRDAIEVKTRDRFTKEEFLAWKADHTKYLDVRFEAWSDRHAQLEYTVTSFQRRFFIEVDEEGRVNQKNIDDR